MFHNQVLLLSSSPATATLLREDLPASVRGTRGETRTRLLLALRLAVKRVAPTTIGAGTTATATATATGGDKHSEKRRMVLRSQVCDDLRAAISEVEALEGSNEAKAAAAVLREL